MSKKQTTLSLLTYLAIIATAGIASALIVGCATVRAFDVISTQELHQRIDQADTDGDGQLSVGELEDLVRGLEAK